MLENESSIFNMSSGFDLLSSNLNVDIPFSSIYNDSLELVPNEPQTEAFNIPKFPISAQNYEIQSENILNKQNREIFQNHNQNKNKSKKALGRKRKKDIFEESDDGEHTKYSEDNMIRKIKVYLIKAILDIINSKIQEIKKEIDLRVTIEGKEYKVIKLLNINQKQIKDTSVSGNIKLLEDKLSDIFSVDIAGNYDKYPKCFNKYVIKKLLYEINNTKIIEIFEKTFLDCLKYYRKDQNVILNDEFSCLKGLEEHFDNLGAILKQKDNKISEDYINDLIDLIKNYEYVYDSKTPRQKRKK